LGKAQKNKGKRKLKPQLQAPGSPPTGKKQVKAKNPVSVSSPEEPEKPVGMEKPSGFGKQVSKMNKYLPSQSGVEHTIGKELYKKATEEKKLEPPASHMPKLSKAAGLAMPAKIVQHGTRVRDTLSKFTKGNSSANQGAPKILDVLDKLSIRKLKQSGPGMLKSTQEGEPNGSRNNRSQSHQLEFPSPNTVKNKRQSGLLNSSIGAFARKDSSPVKGSSKLPGLRATIQMKLQMNNPLQTKGSLTRPQIHGKLSVNIGKSKNYDQYSGENKEIDNTLLNMRLKNNKMDTGKPDFFSRGSNNIKTPTDPHSGPRPRSPAKKLSQGINPKKFQNMVSKFSKRGSDKSIGNVSKGDYPSSSKTRKSNHEIEALPKPQSSEFKCGFVHLMLLKGCIRRWAKQIRKKIHERKVRESFFQENYGVINSVLRKNKEDCILLKKNHPVN
jgi:hypothetical protein